MQEYDVALKLLLRGSAKLTMRELTGTAVENWIDVELPKVVQNTRVDRIAGLVPVERETALGQLIILAGLRQLEETIEQEARKMPILNDLLDNKVLGREFKRGELTVLRRQIEKRFGAIPSWAEERLVGRSAADLEELSVRVLDAQSIEDLLK